MTRENTKNIVVSIVGIFVAIFISSNTLISFISYKIIKIVSMIFGILALYNYFVKQRKDKYYCFAKYMLIITLIADVLAWDIFSIITDIVMAIALYVCYKKYY